MHAENNEQGKPMGILVSTCVEDSDCVAINTQLKRLGIAAPAASDGKGLDPFQLLGRMNRMHNPVTASDRFQREPGKVWEFAFSEIVLANPAEGMWGWADTRNLRYLEFWKTMVPDMQILLTYSSPASSIAAAFAGGDPSPKQLKSAVKWWMQYQEETLRFYHQHHNSALLCHISHIRKGSDAFRDLCIDRFSLPTDCPPLHEHESDKHDALLRHLCQEVASEYPDAQTIFEELESSADLPDPKGGSSAASASAAIRLLKQLRTQTEETQQQAQLLSEAQRSEIEKLNEDRDTLQAQMEDQEEHSHLLLTRLHEALSQLDQRAEDHREEIAAAQQVTGQLQTELETARKLGYTIDLSGDIAGSNWYDAEKGGRWAGPRTVSTIELPPGLKGLHILNIRVSAGMSTKLLKETSVEYNGATMRLFLRALGDQFGRKMEVVRILSNLKPLSNPYPAQLIAQVHLDTDKAQTLTFHFPETFEASPGGVQRALKLRAIRLEAIS